MVTEDAAPPRRTLEDVMNIEAEPCIGDEVGK